MTWSETADDYPDHRWEFNAGTWYGTKTLGDSDGCVCLAAWSTLDAQGLHGKTHGWSAGLTPPMATYWHGKWVTVIVTFRGEPGSAKGLTQVVFGTTHTH